MMRKRVTGSAVLIPAAEWQRLHGTAKSSLKDLLLATDARTEFLVPQRRVARKRRVEQPRP